MYKLEDYPFEIRPMTSEEGGGYLISFPDFNVCFSDGETIDEAIKNGMDALKSAILAMEDLGIPVPAPMSGGFAGKFMTRIPMSLHAKLASMAQHENVSINTLVMDLLAKCVDKQSVKQLSK